MADWNPNEPRLLGQEWMPTVQSGLALVASSQVGAAGFTSTAAQTVLTLGACFSGLTELGEWLMEIYPETDAVIGPDATEIFRPILDVARVNATNQAGATTNLYQSIDEAVLSLTDYVTTTVGASASYDHELNTSTWAAARRVKDIQITFVGRQIAGSHLWQLLVNDSAEGFFTYFSQTIASETGLFTTTVSLGESNPFTGLPWWESDIEDFDNAGAGKYLRWRWVNPSDENAEARLYQVYMTVIYADENRVAVAAFTPTTDGWDTASVVTPAGGASWSKLNATDYVVTMRRFRKSGAGTGGGTDVPPPAETGRASWSYLEGSEYVPSRWSWAAVLDTLGGIETLGAQGARGFAFIMETNAPVVSTDSQPYNALRRQLVGETPGFEGVQTMTPSVNQTPTRIRFLVDATVDLESSQLIVDVSEATTINTWQAVVSASDVEASPYADAAQQWRLVEADLAVTAGTGTITAPNQVTVQFYAFGASPPQWPLAYLQCVNIDGGTGVGSMFTNPGTGTYGGTTDTGLSPYDLDGTDGFGPSVAANGDYAMQLVQPPTAPANPVGVAGTSTVPGDGSNCSADLVNGADLAWDATALGATFARYEIGRDEGDGIVVILSQLDESIEAAYDYTALRGVAADYWLRVVDTLGIASDWVSLGTFTSAAVDCELIFVSNERLDVTVTGQDEPLREWDFLSPPATIFVQVEGRDYQLEIKPTEWRGDAFTRDVMLWGASNGTAPPGGSGRVVFDRILELAQADVAYVAVLDSSGRRWLAAIQPRRGRRLMPGEQHVVTVDTTEITDDPLVEITGAQVAP